METKPITAMSQAEMAAEIEKLRVANAKLTAKRTGKLTFKVSAKGGVSVYGLGRFPVSLYASQWERLLGEAENIKAFILENAANLSSKEEKVAAPAPATVAA